MDNALKGRKFPGFTTQELIERLEGLQHPSEIASEIAAEVDRRKRVEFGDVSAMTPIERLRYAK